MTRIKTLIRTLLWMGVSLGFILVLIGLFRTANRPQTGSQALQTIVPTIEATAGLTPGPLQTASTAVPTPTTEAAVALTPALPMTQTTFVSPIATPGSRPAGILFESTGALYWQPVDEQGKALAAAARSPIDLAAGSKIGQLFPAPDGSQVVYEVYSPPPGGCCELESTLYIFSPPDGQPRQLLAPPRLPKIFGWHPNSRQLVYGGEDGTIGLFDVNTSERTLVGQAGQAQKWADLPYGPDIDGIAFSPDGQRLVASFTLSGQKWEAWIANADGSEPKKLFESDGAVFGFAWSPDGKSIAFLGEGVEVMSADGQDQKVVSQNFNAGWGHKLHWSPDSRFIAFAAWEDLPEYKSIIEADQKVFQYHKIHIVDITTGEERRLVPDDSGGDINPAWSPDGKHVIFLSNRSGASDIWMTSLDGAELQQLTSDGQPKRWTPIWLTASGG